MFAEGAPDATVAVLVAGITALGLILVAVIPLLWSTRKHAKEANEAVNCRPKDAPKISEVVDGIATDLREVRHEQAALALMLGAHIAEHRRDASS